MCPCKTRSRAPLGTALERYRDLQWPAAQFNVSLLEQLRPRWEQAVRPDTSMWMLLFTRPGVTGYRFGERVEVLLESAELVRMAFVRQVPRRSESEPGGLITVTGDFTKPENALPALEALLYQLATPADT